MSPLVEKNDICQDEKPLGISQPNDLLKFIFKKNIFLFIFMCMCVPLSELTGTKCVQETLGEKRALSDLEPQ